MSSFPTFDAAKDPDDLTDQELTFSEAMPVDDVITAINDVEITVDKAGPASTSPDVATQSMLFSGQSAIVWVSGGQPGWRYLISVEVATVQGRVIRRRALLNVKLQ